MKTMKTKKLNTFILLSRGTNPGRSFRYTCTVTNCHIKNSSAVPKRQFTEALWGLRYREVWCQALWLRSLKSLEAEWGVHNVLYRLGLFRSHTKDLDLNYPQRWSWLYRITWALTKWIAR